MRCPRSRMKKVLILLVVVGMFAAMAVGQEIYVKFSDEAPKDASFLAFRTKLIAAAERKDLKYVLSIMDPKINLSFGGHEGVKDFRKLWKKDSDFWAEFIPVIKNGGSFNEYEEELTAFSAPYVFTDMPEMLDQFEHFVVFGSDVNLREKPDLNSRVIAKLSYNVVKVDPEAAVKRKTGPGEHDWKIDWQKVTTLGGQTGWMKAEFVRSPIDYRAGFEKKRGKWVMTFFIAGD